MKKTAITLLVFLILLTPLFAETLPAQVSTYPYIMKVVEGIWVGSSQPCTYTVMDDVYAKYSTSGNGVYITDSGNVIDFTNGLTLVGKKANYLTHSNHDIKNTANGTIFFAAPSPLTQALVGVKLSQILTQTLILIPLILVSVIFFLGFRKSFQTLSILLSKS